MFNSELLSDYALQGNRNTLIFPMSTFLDKEYHPVIEEFIFEFSEERLTTTERDAFVEVLDADDDLGNLARSARDGRLLMEMLRDLKEIDSNPIFNNKS